MAEAAASVELSIDSAGSPASVALSRAGSLIAELTWRTRNNHAAELLPVVDLLLEQNGLRREQIAVVFVDRGPGGYAGLRVGLSTAMGLALGLGAELVAAGRLEIDAYPHLSFPGPVCAVHQAGRGDVAWAVYERQDTWQEIHAPRLTGVDEMLDGVPAGVLFCGELTGLAERVHARRPEARIASEAASIRRAAALAELGWQRYSEGVRDNPVAVEALYLREPSITMPKSRPAPA
jgi:tRNA threonylcarbamoyladenosine biosynthesis protein TsaB